VTRACYYATALVRAVAIAREGFDDTLDGAAARYLVGELRRRRAVPPRKRITAARLVVVGT
jgi:hypothetical protein